MICDCTEPCHLDRFQPATRELMVFTKSSKRFFDLDAVRERPQEYTPRRSARVYEVAGHTRHVQNPLDENGQRIISNPAGAPPLDWWLIPYTEPTLEERGESPMTATFHVGDAIEVMSKLPEKSVDLILTSPPFLALRSYLPADHPDKALEGGSQATPGEYVDWLIDVVEACARVLAPHGSLVFELGDTYAGSGGSGGDYEPSGLREGQERFTGSGARQWQAKFQREQKPGYEHSFPVHRGPAAGGGKGWALPKSLSLIPESFRFAMVYGRNPFTGRTTAPWRLRNVIRWVRPNPPVGALGDKFRPATSELMVFCKARDRYFDLDAVREPHKPESIERGAYDFRGLETGSRNDDGQLRAGLAMHSAGAPPLDWWNIPLLEKNGVAIDLAAKALEVHLPDDLKPYAYTYAETVLYTFGRSFQKTNESPAPPLDWWNMPLLDGEEPTPYGPKEPRPNHGRVGEDATGKKAEGRGNWSTFPTRTENPLGAPPLDWWNIPPGGYSGFTTRTVRVPIDLATFDGFSGDIQRTVSADCPEHGDQPDQAPTESHDGRAGIESSRNPGNGGHPARGLDPDSVPTDQLPLLNLEDGSSDSPLPQSTPAATRRSKASNRTAPAPATNSPGTASDRTAVRIAGTSTEPPTGGPHPDTPENRTSEVSLGEAPLGTPGHIADTKTERSGEACTCSYYVEKSDNTSHYAVWPPELLIKPIKAMCPEQVCRQCGEPRRRITESERIVEGRVADKDEPTYRPDRGATTSWDQRVYTRTRGDYTFGKQVTTLGFSDCGHDDYRPGLVLDPFAGSGTTLSVATGHGRDAIGIDLDERNYDLALGRVGPLVLQQGVL